MIGLCFVLVMVALDQTVIGTALPTIVAELNGFELYAWVGTSYLLTSVITVPIFGKLGDEYGRKSFIVIAIVLFTLASMLCGMAQSMFELVLARALQGIGGGMLVATSFASIPDIFPDTHERLRWQVLFSTAFGLANAVGPSLGGYLTEYWGWRWVFFVNLPVGILSLAFIWYFLPKIRYSKQPPSSMDWLGAFLIALTLGSLQLMVEWLLQSKPYTQLIPLGLLGIIAGCTLFWWERRCENPVIPFTMFKHNILGPVFALSSMMGFCLFAIMYYAPLMFQGGFGLSPNQAGVLITPLAVFITVGSITNGRIMSKIDSPNLVLYFGLSAFFISAAIMTQVTTITSHTIIMAAMALAGLGIGLLLPNLTLIVQASAAKTQLGIATAMLQSMRMVGSMMGAAVIGSIISSQYTMKVHALLVVEKSPQLESSLDNPQILFSQEKSDQFLHLLKSNTNEGLYLLANAREALVNAVHDSQWFITALVLVAFWLAYRIPKVNIHSRISTVTSGNP
jgi:EmrB/QacA subfamily drug resistance transporter